MGNVIFLNGCSSSGKTTVALKLQQLLQDPYLLMALDQFRDGMPMRFRGMNSPGGTPGSLGMNIVPSFVDGEPRTDVEFGEYGEQVLAGMRRSIALFSDMGLNVIVDDLLFEPSYLHDYVDVLDADRTWFIGLHCPLDVVNERESLRIGRFPGTATSHFERVHTHGASYDLEIDTSTTAPREAAEQIIARLGHPPQSFARLQAARS